MDEEETNEESEDTTSTEDEGSKPTTTPLIDIANAAAERMEKANEETARLMKLQEDRDARIALGGRSEAGQATQEVSEEDAKKAGAKEFFKGTQLEKDIEKL